MSVTANRPPKFCTFSLRATRLMALGLLAVVSLSACGIPLGGNDAPRLMGFLADHEFTEISGLARSQRSDNVYWIHNDGGNSKTLYAINQYGIRQSTLTIDGVTKTDWEDIDSFTLKGKPYLLIADVGDNGGLRKSIQFHIIAEPSTLSNQRLTPSWSIAVKYPDGPHDCEAAVVDVATMQILIITKKRQPPIIYSVPLIPTDKSVQIARRIGTVYGIPSESAQDQRDRPTLAPYDHQVTAASIAPNGNAIELLTYRYLLHYNRTPNQSWADAIASTPRIRTLPLTPQAEAMGYTRDGKSVMVTGEYRMTPLYKIPVAP